MFYEKYTMIFLLRYESLQDMKSQKLIFPFRGNGCHTKDQKKPKMLQGLLPGWRP